VREIIVGMGRARMRRMLPCIMLRRNDRHRTHEGNPAREVRYDMPEVFFYVRSDMKEVRC
jgi:hypothetical protein